MSLEEAGMIEKDSLSEIKLEFFPWVFFMNYHCVDDLKYEH